MKRLKSKPSFATPLAFMLNTLILASTAQAARVSETTILSAESAEWTNSGGVYGGATTELRLVNLSSVSQTVRVLVYDESVDSNVSTALSSPWTFDGTWSHHTKTFSRTLQTDADGVGYHERIVLAPRGQAGASHTIRMRATCDWCASAVSCDTNLADTTPACSLTFPVSGKSTKYTARFVVNVKEDRGAVSGSLWVVAGMGAALHQVQDRFLYQLNGGRPF